MNDSRRAAPIVVSLTVRAVLGSTQAGGAVFSGRSVDGVALRVVASAETLPRLPRPGEYWEVEGDERINAQYGRQLIAHRCVHRFPTGRLLIEYLALHPDYVGIGHAKARRLYAAFGAELVSVLDRGDVASLATVIQYPLAENLAIKWTEHRAEAGVVAFLDAHHFDVRLANKLRRVWGDRAIEMLTLNPFYLLAFAGWRQVDAAATNLGIAVDDERRFIGAVESTLYDRLDQAHTLTDLPTLLRGVAQRLRTPDAHHAITLALKHGVIVGDSKTGYQTVGAAAMERDIATGIRAMLAVSRPLPRSAFCWEDITREWLQTHIAASATEQKLQFNTEQQAAVGMALTEPFSLLCGGAGVGKTTVLNTIIHLAHQLSLTVLQMALAGRAAKRMMQATDQPAMTIAKFLMLVKNGELTVLPDSMVIIDEASMLDLSTMHRILRALPDGARLLLVGDPAQLPPIGFGLVFHRLAESDEIPRTELIQVHRQAATTGIPAIAHAIRVHQLPALPPCCESTQGVSMVDCRPEDVIRHLLNITAAWHDDDWQIIGATKVDINRINQAFHQHMQGRARSTTLPGWRFAVGDPVIHLVNDYHRELMNGSIGRIVAVDTDIEHCGLQLDFEGEQHFFTPSQLAGRIDLAYAISGHKAQGSQFQRVAVVVSESRILDQSWIYTAVTRGVEQVVLVGDKSILEAAVQRPALARRRQVAFFNK
jgi:exodeoxyribonuclease V alpha subunit